MSHVPHPHADVLRRYARDPSDVDPVGASSIEAHLVSCDGCRTSLNGAVGRPFIDASWEAVVDRVDQPRRSAFELALARVGISETSARLLAATPTLRVAATAAVAIVAALAVVASQAGDGSEYLLALAPLVPLGVVAMTFAATTEPAGEVAIGTPLHGLGLVARRSVVVAVVAFAALGLADVAIGDAAASNATWVLPSLALTASVVALATWVRVELVTALLGGGWVALVWPMRLVVDRSVDVGDSIAFTVEGQVVAACLVVASVAAVWVRRDRFESVEVFA